MSPERKLDIDIARWAIQALARWMLTVAVVLGSLIVIGGKERFTGVSYEAALRYPYAPESWGIVLLVVGVVGLIASVSGKLRMVGATLYAEAVWCLFFAYSFAETATKNPVAGTTGPAIYAGASVVLAVLGVVHWKSATLDRQRAILRVQNQRTPDQVATELLALNKILRGTTPSVQKRD